MPSPITFDQLKNLKKSRFSLAILISLLQKGIGLKETFIVFSILILGSTIAILFPMMRILKINKIEKIP